MEYVVAAVGMFVMILLLSVVFRFYSVIINKLCSWFLFIARKVTQYFSSKKDKQPKAETEKP